MTDGITRHMDNSPESITGRVRKLRERAGLSMREMAKAMGYAHASSIQRYENPAQLKPGYLTRDLVAKIEKAVLGKGSPPITRPEIWELAGPEFNFGQPHQPNAIIGDELSDSVSLIPVYGSAVAGINGEFEMNGAVLYEVMSPPGLSGVKGAYAVLVAGESMEPRYFDGETVFVDPNRRVTKGNFVVAQIQREQNGPILAFVKLFVRHNAAELVLEQYNPREQLRFPHEQVVSVHFIVMGGMAS